MIIILSNNSNKEKTKEIKKIRFNHNLFIDDWLMAKVNLFNNGSVVPSFLYHLISSCDLVVLHLRPILLRRYKSRSKRQA
jgi:hypothetical protein